PVLVAAPSPWPGAGTADRFHDRIAEQGLALEADPDLHHQQSRRPDSPGTAESDAGAVPGLDRAGSPVVGQYRLDGGRCRGCTGAGAAGQSEEQSFSLGQDCSKSIQIEGF